MKDLEKIKSEDLACQVQDANPGNFAIEQEVPYQSGAATAAVVPADNGGGNGGGNNPDDGTLG